MPSEVHTGSVFGGDSGTFTFPLGSTNQRVTCIGGAGAGATGTDTLSGGGGGGGGSGYREYGDSLAGIPKDFYAGTAGEKSWFIDDDGGTAGATIGDPGSNASGATGGAGGSGTGDRVKTGGTGGNGVSGAGAAGGGGGGGGADASDGGAGTNGSTGSPGTGGGAGGSAGGGQAGAGGSGGNAGGNTGNAGGTAGGGGGGGSGGSVGTGRGGASGNGWGRVVFEWDCCEAAGAADGTGDGLAKPQLTGIGVGVDFIAAAYTFGAPGWVLTNCPCCSVTNTCCWCDFATPNRGAVCMAFTGDGGTFDPTGAKTFIWNNDLGGAVSSGYAFGTGLEAVSKCFVSSQSFQMPDIIQVNGFTTVDGKSTCYKFEFMPGLFCGPGDTPRLFVQVPNRVFVSSNNSIRTVLAILSGCTPPINIEVPMPTGWTCADGVWSNPTTVSFPISFYDPTDGTNHSVTVTYLLELSAYTTSATSCSSHSNITTLPQRYMTYCFEILGAGGGVCENGLRAAWVVGNDVGPLAPLCNGFCAAGPVDNCSGGGFASPTCVVSGPTDWDSLPPPNWQYACCPGRTQFASNFSGSMTGVAAGLPFNPGCDECLNGGMLWVFQNNIGPFGEPGYQGTYAIPPGVCRVAPFDNYTAIVVRVYCQAGIWIADAAFRAAPGSGDPDILIETTIMVEPCTPGFLNNYIQVALTMNPGTNCFAGCPCFGGAIAVCNGTP